MSGIFSEMISNIKSQMNTSVANYIPDIITFCESPHYLNITNNPGNPITLYPLQRIGLKVFYRGTQGNENLTLTEEERQLLLDENMEYVIDKFDNKKLFRECVLVWGRRSGKDLISSFIATYETMRLLEIPGGNPFAYYKIKEGNPIYILTVAGSDPQAKILFNDVKTAVLSSPYFQDKIGDDGKALDSSSIHLLTPSDREMNKDRVKKGLEPTRGNVVILAGHSNSDTLRGKRTYCLLLDEVASYKTTSGSSGGDAIFNSLAPSTNDFRVRYEDENGKMQDRLDSKIVSISSPRGKDGIFWRMYNDSFDPELGTQRFMMRAPTWKVNLQHTRESCRRDFSTMSEQEFSMEFGAEFAGMAGENFIPEEYVDRAINKELGQKEFGFRGVMHFAHLDPAATSHNYALAIIHVESYIRNIPIEGTVKTRKEQRKRFVVDHLKVWTPTGDKAIDFEMVDQYVINISKLFRFAMVSYDAFESRQSMQKLRKAGIPAKITQFRKRYKVEIYRNLENLLIAGDIVLPGRGPHAKLLELELKNLKRKWTASGGFSIGPNEEGEVRSDDLADSLAGACGSAIGEIESSYVKPSMAYTPLIRNDPIWRIGSGTYSDLQFKQYDSRFGIGHY